MRPPLTPHCPGGVGWLRWLPRAAAETRTFELGRLFWQPGTAPLHTGCQRVWEAVGAGWSVHIAAVTEILPHCCQEEVCAAADSTQPAGNLGRELLHVLLSDAD